MAIELSSAGVTIQYSLESVEGVRPITGYTIIPGAKSIPDLNAEPSALQTTDLSQTRFHTYIQGLIDVGGTLGITFNLTQSLMNMWKALIAAYETAKDDGMRMWFSVVIPGLEEAFYFAVEPSELGLSPIEVDSVLEIDAYVAPLTIDGWQTKHTS